MWRSEIHINLKIHVDVGVAFVSPKQYTSMKVSEGGMLEL